MDTSFSTTQDDMYMFYQDIVARGSSAERKVP